MKRLLLAAALLWSGGAQADWQYTKWGMTPDQVIAASGGKATRKTTDSKNALGQPQTPTTYISAEYRVRDVTMSVNFVFNDRGLRSVELTPLRYEDRQEVFLSLLSRYGRPVERSEGRESNEQLWRDEANGNLVNRHEIYMLKLVTVTYRPLSDGEGW